MAGLVSAIHVFLSDQKQDVDARDKRGHDEGGLGECDSGPHILVIRGGVPTLYFV